MGRGEGGRRMKTETQMFQNNESQQARRARQAERLKNARRNKNVTKNTSNTKAQLTDEEISSVEKIAAKINKLRTKVKTDSKMSLSQLNKNRSEYQKQLNRLIKFAERKGYQTPQQDGVIDYSTIKPSLGEFLGVNFVM